MPALNLSPYLSIVLGVTLSVVFCLAAGLCRRYAQLHSPDPVSHLTNSVACQAWPKQSSAILRIGGITCDVQRVCLEVES